MRFGSQGDEALGIEAARLSRDDRELGVRWPAGVLLRAWIEVPSFFMLVIVMIFGTIGLVAWGRNRRR